MNKRHEFRISTGDEADDLHHIIEDSYIHRKGHKDETNLKSSCNIYIIENKSLDKEFHDFINSLYESNTCMDECNLEVSYGFTVGRNRTDITNVCENGINVSKDSNGSTLGSGSMGCYLTMHADVALKYHMDRNPKQDYVYLLVFKYVLGRTTKAVCRPENAKQYIEPTAGYDSHTSVLDATLCPNNISDCFNRSQIYLYNVEEPKDSNTETGSNLLISRPNNIIPYAIVTYTADDNTDTEHYFPFYESPNVDQKCNTPEISANIENITNNDIKNYVPSPIPNISSNNNTILKAVPQPLPIITPSPPLSLNIPQYTYAQNTNLNMMYSSSMSLPALTTPLPDYSNSIYLPQQMMTPAYTTPNYIKDYSYYNDKLIMDSTNAQYQLLQQQYYTNPALPAHLAAAPIATSPLTTQMPTTLPTPLTNLATAIPCAVSNLLIPSMNSTLNSTLNYATMGLDQFQQRSLKRDAHLSLNIDPLKRTKYY